MNYRNHLIALAFTVFALTGCVRSVPAFVFYDECAAQAPSFVAAAECGRVNYYSYCQSNNTCTMEDNAITQYADSLVLSVRNHDLPEPEAQRRWIEFRMDQINAARQQALQSQAIFAASQPRTCYGSRHMMNCF